MTATFCGAYVALVTPFDADDNVDEAAYRRLIEQHEVDLLVLNTKDEDQLAMRGIAYALAVELRQTPLLML